MEKQLESDDVGTDLVSTRLLLSEHADNVEQIRLRKQEVEELESQGKSVKLFQFPKRPKKLPATKLFKI